MMMEPTFVQVKYSKFPLVEYHSGQGKTLHFVKKRVQSSLGTSGVLKLNPAQIPKPSDVQTACVKQHSVALELTSVSSRLILIPNTVERPCK